MSCLMLLVPIAEVWWVTSFEVRPTRLAGGVLLLLWFASGATGLLYGVRSLRLTSRRTFGFGILAVLLHVGVLFCFVILSGVVNH